VIFGKSKFSNCSAVAVMGDRFATIHMGRGTLYGRCVRKHQMWGCCAPFPWEGSWIPSNTMSSGPRLGWMDQDATWWEVGLGPGDIALDGDASSSKSGAQQPIPTF